MNQVPVRRRSAVSLFLGALAMAGSLAVMGVLVLSDVADAKAPRKSVPVKVARVEQQQQQTVQDAAPSLEESEEVAPEPEQKPAARKRTKKAPKVDFGRYEGY
jgi:hypothetical protein